MKKPDHDCGPPCAALSEREHAFHLIHLAAPGKPIGPVYSETCEVLGKDIPTPGSCSSMGCRMLKLVKVRAAIQHHRAIEAIRYRETKEASSKRLAARADGSKAKHFFTIGADGEVTVENWDGVDGELTRAIGSVELHPDGSLKKLTVRDGVPAEAALAKLHGWNEPDELDILDNRKAAEKLGLDPDEVEKAMGSSKSNQGDT